MNHEQGTLLGYGLEAQMFMLVLHVSPEPVRPAVGVVTVVAELVSGAVAAVPSFPCTTAS